MNRWVIYLKTVLRHPVRALIALFWRCLGKKIRAKNHFGAMMTHVTKHYVVWQILMENMSASCKNQLLAQIDKDIVKPKIGVFLTGNTDNEGFRHSTAASLEGQWLAHFELISGEDIPPDCQYVTWIKAGDQLSADAVLRMTIAIIQEGSPDILYSDEDLIDQKGRRRFAHFKPQWNYELLKVCDYIGGLCLIKLEALKSCAIELDCHHWSARYEALLSLGRRKFNGETITVKHVPHVLYHRRRTQRQIEYLIPQVAEKNIQHHFLDGEESIAGIVNGHFGFPRFQHVLPSPQPLVSIIVCTFDALHLLKPCIRSVLDKSTYQNFEIIIVDNGSQQPETIDWLHAISSDDRVRVIRDDQPFNFSALNNRAVEQAAGDYICLLNNDTEVIDPEWLDEMMAYAVQPHVGAVGAQLLYADNRIQHAGVIMGLGRVAGHGHRFLNLDDAGYFYRAHLPQEITAVTAACLVVSKAKYNEVGGLNERELVVAFNDVDFCLKLDENGYKNIYTPYARLYHYESKSRGKDISGEKRERYLREVSWMKERWKTATKVDRFYHPELTIKSEDFAVRITDTDGFS